MLVKTPGHTKIQGIGVPSRKARKPSMTATMGLMDYSMRQFSGIADAG